MPYCGAVEMITWLFERLIMDGKAGGCGEGSEVVMKERHGYVSCTMVSWEGERLPVTYDCYCVNQMESGDDDGL